MEATNKQQSKRSMADAERTEIRKHFNRNKNKCFLNQMFAIPPLLCFSGIFHFILDSICPIVASICFLVASPFQRCHSNTVKLLFNCTKLQFNFIALNYSLILRRTPSTITRRPSDAALPLPLVDDSTTYVASDWRRTQPKSRLRLFVFGE